VGSTPDGDVGIFFYPSGRNAALGSTLPLTEMSTSSLSWEVKAAGAGHLHETIFYKFCERQLPGALKACPGL